MKLRALKGSQLDSDLAALDELQGFERAQNTHLAYAADWQQFTLYLAQSGELPQPGKPYLVQAFLSHLWKEGYKVATINRKLEAIKSLYDEMPGENPCLDPQVKTTLKQIRRKLKGQKPKKAPAALLEHMQKVLSCCPASPLGLRDAALMSLGWTCALRLDEYANFKQADLDLTSEPDGAWLTVQFSKTDQEGTGELIWIPRDEPLRVIERMQAYLSQLPDRSLSAPLFWGSGQGKKGLAKPMSYSGVKYCIAKSFSRAKLPQFSPHSLRHGFITECIAAGASADEVQAVSRHRCTSTLHRYVQLNAKKSHPTRRFTHSMQTDASHVLSAKDDSSL